MKPTFTERKALMQLQANPFLTPEVLRSKRSMALIERLKERGWVNEENEVTEAGEEAIAATRN